MGSKTLEPVSQEALVYQDFIKAITRLLPVSKALFITRAPIWGISMVHKSSEIASIMASFPRWDGVLELSSAFDCLGCVSNHKVLGFGHLDEEAGKLPSKSCAHSLLRSYWDKNHVARDLLVDVFGPWTWGCR